MIKKLDNKATQLKAIRLLCEAYNKLCKEEQTLDIFNNERQWIENLLYKVPSNLYIAVNVLNWFETEFYIFKNNQVFVTDDFDLFYVLIDYNVVSITV